MAIASPITCSSMPAHAKQRSGICRARPLLAAALRPEPSQWLGVGDGVRFQRRQQTRLFALQRRHAPNRDDLALNNNMFMGGAFAPTLPANWRDSWCCGLQPRRQGRLSPLQCQQRAKRRSGYLSGPTLISGAYGPMIASGYIFDRSGRFQRGRQARLRALWSERPGNHPLVSRQQCLHRQRQWSNASGWLSLTQR